MYVLPPQWLSRKKWSDIKISMTSSRPMVNIDGLPFSKGQWLYWITDGALPSSDHRLSDGLGGKELKQSLQGYPSWENSKTENLKKIN